MNELLYQSFAAIPVLIIGFLEYIWNYLNITNILCFIFGVLKFLLQGFSYGKLSAQKRH